MCDVHESFELFQIPTLARAAGKAHAAGGIGGGRFRIGDSGEFRGWRMNSGCPEDGRPVEMDRYYLWMSQHRRSTAGPITNHGAALPHAQLFPFTWRRYPAEPLRIESLSFSPLLPNRSAERSLPIHVIAFRVHNPTNESTEAALMLTWVCAWPDQVEDSAFDFQHDNLCLTGSLGSPASPNRQGIAVPDLHYVGIYQEGIEPWATATEEPEIVSEFAEDGELDPRVSRGGGQGAAAWVKFDIGPGETKEIPFVLAWSFPRYETGPLAGRPRHYTQFLGRRRPDNAIVWLAEQAVQHYGTEVAQYRHWQQEIEDWQRTILADPSLMDNQKLTRFRALAALVESDHSWDDHGQFVIEGNSSIREDLRSNVREVWPDIAGQL